MKLNTKLSPSIGQPISYREFDWQIRTIKLLKRMIEMIAHTHTAYSHAGLMRLYIQAWYCVCDIK